MKKLNMIIFLVIFVMVVCVGFSYAQEQKILLANSFRDFVEEYWVLWSAGSENAAKVLGCDYLPLSANSQETKQIADLESAIARGVDGIEIQPVTTDTLTSMVNFCEEEEVWFVTMWDKPDELLPKDYKYWAAHITMDDVRQGYVPGKVLFDALGGKGKVVAIGGLVGDSSATNRYEGLKIALKEYPGIELLDYQIGDWSRVKGVSIMEDFLASYGDEIDGLWCACDDMALGALEVIKSEGLAGGKIKIVGVDAIKEAVENVIKGDMYATVSGDSWYMGGLGLVYLYNAVKGNILPEEEQIIMLELPVVYQSNAEEYYQSVFVGERTIDWEKISEELVSKIQEVSK